MVDETSRQASARQEDETHAGAHDTAEVSDDYATFRGKCKEASEALCKDDPTLRLARGHYICPLWGGQQHWWCVRPDGSIVDPTVRQFPSTGMGEYREWDGRLHCEYCGGETSEQTATIDGRHVFCSYTCYGKTVM